MSDRHAQSAPNPDTQKTVNPKNILAMLINNFLSSFQDQGYARHN